MTYDFDCALPEEFLEPILEHGLGVVPELIRTVINAAMELERQQRLGGGALRADRKTTRLFQRP